MLTVASLVERAKKLLQSLLNFRVLLSAEKRINQPDFAAAAFLTNTLANNLKYCRIDT
jgi:hypothetical protein